MQNLATNVLKCYEGYIQVAVFPGRIHQVWISVAGESLGFLDWDQNCDLHKDKKQKFTNLSKARLLLKHKQQLKDTWLGLERVSYCGAGLCAGQVVCALRWRMVSGAGWGRGYSPGCRGAGHRGVKEAKTTAVSHRMKPVEQSRKYVNRSEDIVIYTWCSKRMTHSCHYIFSKENIRSVISLNVWGWTMSTA